MSDETKFVQSGQAVVSRTYAEDARDAARYRWLRDTPPWKNRLAVVMGGNVQDDVAILTQEGLDIAIDAAMSGTSPFSSALGGDMDR